MRKFLKPALWAVLAMLLVVLVFVSFNAYYESAFEEEVDRLRAEGVRVDLEQFNDLTFPDESFSAILFREAGQWREDNDLEYCRATDELDLPEGLRPEEIAEAWDAIEEWIGKHEPFYEKVDQALRDPHCSFAVDHREAWNAIVPSMPLSQTIATMYEWRVRLAEHRGESARASLGDCMAVFGWARRVDRGFVICYAVTATVDQVGCAMLKRVAGMQGFDPGETWEALNFLLIRAEDESAMWDAFDGERAVMIHFVRTVASGDGLEQLRAILSEDGEASPWFRAGMTAVRPQLWRNGTESLHYWARARRILEGAGPSALEELKSLSDEWERGQRDDDEQPFWQASSMLFHMMPYKLCKVRMRHIAHLRVARAGLNWLNLRQVTGEWPTGNPGIIDPFTGKPLEPVREGDTVRFEAAVPWLDEFEGDLREDERIYWTLPAYGKR